LLFDVHLPYVRRALGRSPKSRSAIASALVAKAVYNMATIDALLDQLESSIKLRRLCEWKRKVTYPAHQYSQDSLQYLQIANCLIAFMLL
jgi:hypothetical protein